MMQLSALVKAAWKPYTGKGKRTGTPGHYEYEYQLPLFGKSPKPEVGPAEHPKQTTLHSPEPDPVPTPPESAGEVDLWELLAEEGHHPEPDPAPTDEQLIAAKQEQAAQELARILAEQARATLERQAERKQKRDEENARRQAEELARASFSYAWESPTGVVLPRDLDAEGEYRIWIKEGEQWKVLASPPAFLGADGEGAFSGKVAFHTWEHALAQAGYGNTPVFMPVSAEPATSAGGGLIEIEHFKTSPDRPPNFLGLKLDHVGPTDPVQVMLAHMALAGVDVKREGGYLTLSGKTFDLKDKIKAVGGRWAAMSRAWTIAENRLSLNTLQKVFGNPPAAEDPWLAERGFYDALNGDDASRGVDVLKGVDWTTIKRDNTANGAQRRARFARVHRDLCGWWTDLTDEDREEFWSRHCDPTKQTTLGKVTDPRHENASVRIPPGMEAMAVKGWRFHEYQAKAVNFVVDHAPRALLAMEMGLGKTLTAQGIFHEMKARGVVDQMLVTAPLSAHGSWADHFQNLSSARVAVMSGWSRDRRRVTYEQFERGELDVLVMSTDTVRQVWKQAESLSNVDDQRVESAEVERTLTDRNGRKTGTFTTMFHRGPDASEWYRHPGLKALPEWDQRAGETITDSLLVTAPEGALARTHNTTYQMLGGQWRSLSIDGKGATGNKAEPRWLIDDNAKIVAADSFKVEGDEGSAANEVVRFEDPDSDKSILARMMARRGERTLRVADEIHKYKNPASARSKGFWEVVTEPPGPVVGMTGTPKPNGVEDFFHIVNQIKPGALGETYGAFAERFGYRFNDAGNDRVAGLRPEKLGQLYEEAAGVMFVRTTSDPDSKIHLPKRQDLSPKIPLSRFQEEVTEAFPHWVNVKAELRRQERLLEVDSPKYSQSRHLDLIAHLAAAASGQLGAVAQVSAAGAHTNAQVMLLRAQQLAISPSLLSPEWGEANPEYESPKTAAMADAFVEHMSQQPDTGGVIFCTFNKGIAEMRRALERRGVRKDMIEEYTGAVKSTIKRRAIERKLNAGEIKVILGNTKALETGANLQQRANFVGHLNTPWEPAALTQSTARVYRQGQERPVTVLRPVGSDAEALIERVVSRKLMEAGQVTGRSMDADKAVGGTVRGEKLDAATIARILGINPADFGEERLTDALRAELEEA